MYILIVLFMNYRSLLQIFTFWQTPMVCENLSLDCVKITHVNNPVHLIWYFRDYVLVGIHGNYIFETNDNNKHKQSFWVKVLGILQKKKKEDPKG